METSLVVSKQYERINNIVRLLLYEMAKKGKKKNNTLMGKLYIVVWQENSG